MPICNYCEKEFDGSLIFGCKYCLGNFCSDHRLPPNHNCSNIEFWRGRGGVLKIQTIKIGDESEEGEKKEEIKRPAKGRFTPEGVIRYDKDNIPTPIIIESQKKRFRFPRIRKSTKKRIMIVAILLTSVGIFSYYYSTNPDFYLNLLNISNISKTNVSLPISIPTKIRNQDLVIGRWKTEEGNTYIGFYKDGTWVVASEGVGYLGSGKYEFISDDEIKFISDITGMFIGGLGATGEQVQVFKIKLLSEDRLVWETLSGKTERFIKIIESKEATTLPPQSNVISLGQLTQTLIEYKNKTIILRGILTMSLGDKPPLNEYYWIRDEQYYKFTIKPIQESRNTLLIGNKVEVKGTIKSFDKYFCERWGIEQGSIESYYLEAIEPMVKL